jgi:hypothetical protein
VAKAAVAMEEVATEVVDSAVEEMEAVARAAVVMERPHGPRC